MATEAVRRAPYSNIHPSYRPNRNRCLKRVCVHCHVARVGVDNASYSKLFAQQGYRVALVSRTKDHLDKLAAEIKKEGGEAASFPVASYGYGDVLGLFDTIRAHNWGDGSKTEIRGALYNAGAAPFKGFLDVTEQELALSLEAQITGAFAFSRGSILAFRENDVDQKGRRGVLIFTGATASVRGNTLTSAFAAGKHGLRALSQSLAKEFGKENIHVAHAIIDGGILTDRSGTRFKSDEEFEKYKANEDIRLRPEGIGEVRTTASLSVFVLIIRLPPVISISRQPGPVVLDLGA